MIYIQEAHPSDGWVVRGNVREGIEVATPTLLADRRAVAKICAASLKLPMPTLIDRMDNAVNYQYSAWPDRIYVVDQAGRIAVQARHGPFGFKPGVEATADWLHANVTHE